MTPKQRDLARHALGLPNKKKTAYRNHYCIEPGSPDYLQWEDLVSKKMAVKALGGKEWSGDFFYLTFSGAKAALWGDEHLSREVAAKARELTDMST